MTPGHVIKAVAPPICAKQCLDCLTVYVGGYRSIRCRPCAKRVKRVMIARSRQKRRIREGRQPSPALQRIIDTARASDRSGAT